jgi:hypothetical protein
MKCVYCDNEFRSLSSLNNHIKTARYCISKRSENHVPVFECHKCPKTFTSKRWLKSHENKCGENIENIKQKNHDLTNQNDILEGIVVDLKQQIKELQDKLENVAIKAVQRPHFEEETTIDIDDTNDLHEGYKLTPLEMGQGFTIEHREVDGYINVTNLCKAGGKQFKAWKRLEKTKAFLKVLSSEVLISTSGLIKLGNSTFGKEGKQQVTFTWVHPQVAINIAQWISPQFDVKVSGWVYEIMMTGKVDITNTTSFKQLQKENKDHKIKIQYLTKKYVKAQPRIQYEERNVVYILTTKLMKKDRRYILGKATNLTNRLSTYNKSDEHEVVYYQQCGSEETMSLVENMVFMYLKDYREQANRERFVLPEEEEIKYFSQIIKKSVEFFNK